MVVFRVNAGQCHFLCRLCRTPGRLSGRHRGGLRVFRFSLCVSTRAQSVRRRPSRCSGSNLSTDRQGVQLLFIRPGRPVEKGFIESFNGRLRDECLNVSWFAGLEEAREKLGAWRHHYNHERPHSALKDQTPASVAAYHREKERRFAFLRLNRALGGPPQGFAAPAEAALDPGGPAPSKSTLRGEAHLRRARETGVPLLSLWSARNPHFIRSGGL
jgi:Integrase core domain